MSALLVLRSESVHQMTLQYLTAKNQVIRMQCGIVGARRWPAELLKAGRGLFTDQEYAELAVELAAVIAIYRPEQATAASAAAPPDKFATAKSKIAASGLDAIPLGGGVLSLF